MLSHQIEGVLQQIKNMITSCCVISSSKPGIALWCAMLEALLIRVRPRTRDNIIASAIWHGLKEEEDDELNTYVAF